MIWSYALVSHTDKNAGLILGIVHQNLWYFDDHCQLAGKIHNILIFSLAIRKWSFKLCLVVTFIQLYLCLPVSLMLTCQGHSSVRSKWKHIFLWKFWSDWAQLVRASDHYATDTGSVSRCGKGFFSQSQLSVKTLLRVSVHPPCAIACINICAHIKDTVVHVRIRLIMESLKTQHLQWAG